MERSGGLGMFAGMQAQIGDSLRAGAETATAYAERIIARLDVISRGIQNLADPESERVTASVHLDANTVEKVSEARPGYMVTIEHVSVVTEAATTVDILVGTDSPEG